MKFQRKRSYFVAHATISCGAHPPTHTADINIEAAHQPPANGTVIGVPNAPLAQSRCKS